MRNLSKLSIFLIIATSLLSYEVKFTYEDETAKTVHLVGTMNGWDRTAMPFSEKDGKFEIVIELLPGEYEYKFLIDGKIWITDPNNELICHGRYDNSLLIVGTKQEIEEIKNGIKDKAKNITKIERIEEGKIPFRFVVFGDNRGNPEVYKTLLDKISSLSPDFVINTGDLITNPGHLYQWEEFISLSSGYDFPTLFVVGNHDVENERSELMYRDIFTLPGEEIYYSFSSANAEFIILDSEVPGSECKIEGKQLEWLKETLQAGAPAHRFVFIHRPFYPDSLIGRHYGRCLDRYPQTRDSLFALLKKNNVEIIFTGHEHFFLKSLHNGIMQIITGGAGAPLYAEEKDGGFYHFVLVDILEETIGGTLYKLKDGDFTATPIFSLQ